MALVQIVAENLRAVRKDQKLSQHVLGRKARISVSYVSMLERGERTPPLDTLEALATALRVSPLYLLQELGPAGRKTRGRQGSRRSTAPGTTPSRDGAARGAVSGQEAETRLTPQASLVRRRLPPALI